MKFKNVGGGMMGHEQGGACWGVRVGVPRGAGREVCGTGGVRGEGGGAAREGGACGSI